MVRRVRISQKGGSWIPKGIVSKICPDTTTREARHGRRRNQAGGYDAVPLPLALIVHEEERLVLLNRTAQRTSELI